MKIIYKTLFLLILFSHIASGLLHANQEELALKLLDAKEEKTISRGMMIAQRIDSSAVNDKLVTILDSDIKGFIDGDIIRLPPWQDALYILSRRFPEYSTESTNKSFTRENAVAFKKWWALNKHNIIYRDNNTHVYSKSKKEAEQAAPRNR